ncbi:MAG: hypothetical protein ACXAD7_28875, partial [Candidatus Kariarchaeaceae archaeon]
MNLGKTINELDNLVENKDFEEALKLIDTYSLIDQFGDEYEFNIRYLDILQSNEKYEDAFELLQKLEKENLEKMATKL